MESYDVVIVGAGSSGLRLSYLLPKDLKILVIEKNKNVKIKSTCLVSYRFFDIAKELKMEKLVINSFNEAVFNFPHGSFALRSKKNMYLVDVNKFESFLLNHAKRNSIIRFGVRFLDKKNEVIITSKDKIKTKVLVGADGPLSSVAKSNNINLSDEIFSSFEVSLNGKFNNKIEMFFDENYSKNYFVWIVPENKNRAKIGIINEVNSAKSLKDFIYRKFGNVKLEKFYGDVIRIGVPDKTYFEGGFLLGDAAGQLKPYSAGGFTYAAIATQIAADAIKKAFAQNDFSADFFKENYEDKWKKKLMMAIKKGYAVREAFKILRENKLFFDIFKIIKKIVEKTDLDLL